MTYSVGVVGSGMGAAEYRLAETLNPGDDARARYYAGEMPPPQATRPHHRRHHNGHAEQCEGLAALRRREGIGQDRLRDRHHAAAETLQDAE